MSFLNMSVLKNVKNLQKPLFFLCLLRSLQEPTCSPQMSKSMRTSHTSRPKIHYNSSPNPSQIKSKAFQIAQVSHGMLKKVPSDTKTRKILPQKPPGCSSRAPGATKSGAGVKNPPPPPGFAPQAAKKRQQITKIEKIEGADQSSRPPGVKNLT